MIEHTVTLHSMINPETGRGYFRPTSFTEWIGHEVVVTSLDPGLRHVLAAVENREDGATSTLTVHTFSDVDANLSADLSVRPGTPRCQVRAHLADNGQHLLTTHLDAPLQPGQQVLVNNEPHQVADTSWPARDEHGTTDGEDYQHVTLTAVPEQPLVQSLGIAAGIIGMLR